MGFFDRAARARAKAPEKAPETVEVQAIRLALDRLLEMVFTSVAPQYRLMAPACERWLRCLSSEQLLELADATTVFAIEVRNLRTDVQGGTDPDAAVQAFYQRILNSDLFADTGGAERAG